VSTDSTDKLDNSKAVGGKQPFFNASGAIDAYDDSVKWFRPYFAPIPEFERIARNKPSDRIDPTLPKITDGTASSLNQEYPKRIIQQLITGIFECSDYEEYAMLADVVNRYIIIPNQNRMGTALQKHWAMLSKAGTWGRSTSYTFFTENNGTLTTDYIIPYYADVLTEPGKVYAGDSNISHLRSWYQKRDLKAIINREKKFMEENKSYKSDWDLDGLADFMLTSASVKPADQQTPAEREKGDGNSGGFELITAFQDGVDAEFYTFATRGGSDGKARKPLRTKINNDPRGKMPLDHEYYNIDLSNPMGRGLIESIGGVQNLMDQKLQMGQFLNTLLMAPPMKVRGNVNKRSLKYFPNALWDMGTVPTNDVEPYQVNNIALQNFIPDMQFLQSKIYNLTASQDNSIPADSGNAGQSKTQAGVKAADARLGVSDNYIRKQHETWAQDQMETGTNIYFAEMKGTGKLKLKKDDLQDFTQHKTASKFLDGDTLKLPYDKINKVSFKFEADASSSEVKEDADNVEKLTQIYQIMSADPDPEIQQKKAQVLKVLINEIGAEGTDDIFPEAELDENGNPIEAQQAQQPDPNAILQQLMPMVQQMVQEGVQAAQKEQEDPSLQLIKALGIKFNDLPEDARQTILAHVGMESDQQTPAEHKSDIEAFNALGTAEGAIDSKEQAEAQNELQAQSNASQSQTTSTPQEASQSDLTSGLDDEDETALVDMLVQLGFDDNDVQQGVVMAASGMPPDQIVEQLGAKYQGAMA
jgi:hypothetical protein